MHGKQTDLLDLLKMGQVNLHVNTRVQGVQIPDYLRPKETVCLTVGHNMPKPIPDLRVDEVGVFGTLHFPRTGDEYCALPWLAIYALIAGENARMYGRDVPPSVVTALLAQGIKGKPKAKAPLPVVAPVRPVPPGSVIDFAAARARLRH